MLGFLFYGMTTKPCPFQTRPVAGSLAKSAHHLLFLGQSSPMSFWGYAPVAPKGDLFRNSEDDGMKIEHLFSVVINTCLCPMYHILYNVIFIYTFIHVYTISYMYFDMYIYTHISVALSNPFPLILNPNYVLLFQNRFKYFLTSNYIILPKTGFRCFPYH